MSDSVTCTVTPNSASLIFELIQFSSYRLTLYNTQPNTGVHKLVASLSFNYARGLLDSSPIHMSLPFSTPTLFPGTFKLPPAHCSLDKAAISRGGDGKAGESKRAGDRQQTGDGGF